MSEVGPRLRMVREESGLSQTDFGARFGVSRNTQMNYETGARAPDAAYLGAIYDAGLDAFFILTGEHALKDLTAPERRLLAAFQLLDEDRKQAVLNVTELMQPHATSPPGDRGPLHQAQREPPENSGN